MCKDFKDYFNVKIQYSLCHMYLTEDRYWPKKRFHSSCAGFSRVELVAEHLVGNKCHILTMLIMNSQSAPISCEIVTEFSQCDQLVFVHVSHQGPFQLLSLNVWSNLERSLVVTHSISEWFHWKNESTILRGALGSLFSLCDYGLFEDRLISEYTVEVKMIRTLNWHNWEGGFVELAIKINIFSNYCWSYLFYRESAGNGPSKSGSQLHETNL